MLGSINVLKGGGGVLGWASKTGVNDASDVVHALRGVRVDVGYEKTNPYPTKTRPKTRGFSLPVMIPNQTL